MYNLNEESEEYERWKLIVLLPMNVSLEIKKKLLLS